MLRTGKPTHQQLTSRYRIRLTGFGNALDRTKNLGHALRLVREKNSHLRPNHRPVGTRPDRPLLARDRTLPLDDEVVQVLAPHVLKNVASQLSLAVTQSLRLRLKLADLIVDSDPLPQRLPNGLRRIVRHFFVFFRRLENRIPPRTRPLTLNTAPSRSMNEL